MEHITGMPSRHQISHGLCANGQDALLRLDASEQLE